MLKSIKTLVVVLALAVSFTSCTQEETPQPTPSFEETVVKELTFRDTFAGTWSRTVISDVHGVLETTTVEIAAESFSIPGTMITEKTLEDELHIVKITDRKIEFFGRSWNGSGYSHDHPELLFTYEYKNDKGIATWSIGREQRRAIYTRIL